MKIILILTTILILSSCWLLYTPQEEYMLLISISSNSIYSVNNDVFVGQEEFYPPVEIFNPNNHDIDVMYNYYDEEIQYIIINPYNYYVLEEQVFL